MILHLEDPEIDELAQKLADLRKVPKMEAVRAALRHELDKLDSAENWRSDVRALQDKARKMAGPARQSITKEWIDSLYEDG